MIMQGLTAAVLALATLPLVMLLFNIFVFRPPRPRHVDQLKTSPTVSVLIPARNEQDAIGPAIESVLASEDIELELIVLDDHSTDATAVTVEKHAAGDPRVRLMQGPPLPDGWCGKQHACFSLAQAARHDVLVWLDADVRVTPDAIARMAGHLLAGDAALLSGFPRQITRTWSESLVVNLIHFVLLCYLPMAMMRSNRAPGLGAGCGQFVMARRDAYFEIGGHSAVRQSLHDGVTLPRAFRKAGYSTDIVDATSLAVCRMYQSFSEVWRGFAKNATEGMATPVGIWVWTVLLIGGHVAPWLMGIWWLAAPTNFDLMETRQVALACIMAGATSLIVAARFRQPLLAAVSRPAGVTLLLAIQWFAFVARATGMQMRWRGRSYPAR